MFEPPACTLKTSIELRKSNAFQNIVYKAQIELIKCVEISGIEKKLIVVPPLAGLDSARIAMRGYIAR